MEFPEKSRFQELLELAAAEHDRVVQLLRLEVAATQLTPRDVLPSYAGFLNCVYARRLGSNLLAEVQILEVSDEFDRFLVVALSWLAEMPIMELPMQPIILRMLRLGKLARRWPHSPARVRGGSAGNCTLFTCVA
eukprot:TRINITY_DN44829_c0_g1_i1.p1 TRINITY_DN44829_c0_g1~~TRINITY_DN44829_c0_g1_i1.p1  ORF type:complete len:142 (-),score=28.36 TRINITY_DN44829_c0_g1_i1:38-442(-)